MKTLFLIAFMAVPIFAEENLSVGSLRGRNFEVHFIQKDETQFHIKDLKTSTSATLDRSEFETKFPNIYEVYANGIADAWAGL